MKNKTIQTTTESNETGQNPMRTIDIEKMVVHCGGVDDKLEKSIKLLKKITSGTVYIKKSTRRIPAFGISPGKKSGAKVTLRDKKQIHELLRRFFSAIDNKLHEKQITENQACFGIKEYIEIPGLEYERDIGILGFEVMLVFERKGKRVKMRKHRAGKFPEKQHVTPEEIIDYLTEHFNVEVGK
jgi:large subunit ribosomal protein L5